MLRSPRNLLLACSLSALAGYVDGTGYLHLGGMFVSFMSGNSTRTGVNLAQGNFAAAGETLSLIVLFVIGSAFGSLIVRRRDTYSQPWVLFTEAALLAGAGICYALGAPRIAIAAITIAMGLENAVFERGGGIGLTYMTGALVKIGQALAGALSGGPRFDWVPNLLLWASLVAGSIVGAWAYLRISLTAVWFAAAVALLLGIVLAVAQRRKH